MTVFGKCSGGGRRSAPRETAPLLALISTLTHSHGATLVDLSSTGVRLSGEELPDVGEELILSIENIRTFGCIAWKQDGQCGIAFDEPLPPGEVESIRAKAASSRGFSPEMRAAFDDWSLGLAR